MSVFDNAVMQIFRIVVKVSENKWLRGVFRSLFTAEMWIHVMNKALKCLLVIHEISAEKGGKYAKFLEAVN